MHAHDPEDLIASVPARQPGAKTVEIAPTPSADDGHDDIMVAYETAAFLHVNVKTVYEHAKAGTIPCIRLGRHYRFSRRAIMALLGQCKSASHQEGR
jgi:excisionase family DNA binding protein